MASAISLLQLLRIYYTTIVLFLILYYYCIIFNFAIIIYLQELLFYFFHIVLVLKHCFCELFMLFLLLIVLTFSIPTTSKLSFL